MVNLENLSPAQIELVLSLLKALFSGDAETFELLLGGMDEADRVPAERNLAALFTFLHAYYVKQGLLLQGAIFSDTLKALAEPLDDAPPEAQIAPDKETTAPGEITLDNPTEPA